MAWWEICVTLVMLPMVYGLLRSKPSGRDAPSSPRSSRSWQHTSRRLTSPVLDPDRTFHNGPCPNCGAKVLTRLSSSRLEHRPWRLEWACTVCTRWVAYRLPSGDVSPMLALDRAGGMLVSQREQREFAMQLDGIDDAVVEELW
jgi:predicted RNA-binding Zn-ribbon protein involved in translation (DUF1610 family)